MKYLVTIGKAIKLPIIIIGNILIGAISFLGVILTISAFVESNELNNTILDGIYYGTFTLLILFIPNILVYMKYSNGHRRLVFLQITSILLGAIGYCIYKLYFF